VKKLTSSSFSIIYIVFFIAIFYFLLIRPQQKQKKQRAEMISKLSVHDHVVTNGGILGVITKMDENTITVKVANNVEIEFLKGAISGLKPDNV